ncbi:hypothetical protein QQF64_009588 [Cirrhinus molitorella]|uniref:Uncharacterized protein n=1 Tax=Cirrhinus molitorella TaxID=172907 RepID=A0ABR3M1K4_9TELE
MKETLVPVHHCQLKKCPLFLPLHVHLMMLLSMHPHPIPLKIQLSFLHKVAQIGCHGLRSSQFHLFSPEVEMVLKKGMEAYKKDGSLLNVQTVKRDINEHLVKAIHTYTSYPSGIQIASVAEALIRKYPCLKEPGSFSGFYGWQMSLKYKMADYRRRLSKFGFPEVACNSLQKKKPEDRKPAKNVQKPRKAEVNYLPPYPAGENHDSLEQERV